MDDKLFLIYQNNSIKEISEKSFYPIDVIKGVKDYFFHGEITDERFCHNFLSDCKINILNKFN